MSITARGFVLAALCTGSFASAQTSPHAGQEQRAITPRAIGAEVVAAEQALDSLFGERRADTSAVVAAAERGGVLQARLRAEHLNTHIAQTALLSVEQAQRYGELRDYAVGLTPDGSKPPQNSNHHRNTH